MEIRSPLVAVALIALASCTGDDAAPASSPPPEATTTSLRTISTPITSATSATPTTTTTTSTTVPPTTTVPGAGAVTATCTTLQTGTWAERRAAILTMTAQFEAEGGAGPFVDAVRAACPDDLARQEAAVGLEQRADGADLDVLEFEAISCDPGSMLGAITNTAPEAVGFVVAARATASDEVTRWQSGSTLWSVAVGESRQFRSPTAGPTTECAFSAWAFLADGSATDAGTPNGPGPATAGDDPAVWLPALVTVRNEWSRAPTVDGYADFYDLRALGRLRDPQPGEDVHPVASAMVCADAVDQPDADHIAFAYAVEYGPLGNHPGYWGVNYAAFRRGSDQRWRFLAGPYPLDGSLTGANCAPPIPHP